MFYSLFSSKLFEFVNRLSLRFPRYPVPCRRLFPPCRSSRIHGLQGYIALPLLPGASGMKLFVIFSFSFHAVAEKYYI